MDHPRAIWRVGNVAAATSRVSGAQDLAAWLQPAVEDHRSIASNNWDGIGAACNGFNDTSTKRQRVDPLKRWYDGLPSPSRGRELRCNEFVFTGCRWPTKCVTTGVRWGNRPRRLKPDG